MTDIASKVEHISKQLDYVQSGGSSGSGDSSSYVMFVNAVLNDDNEYTTDKPFNEISEHIANGGYVIISYNTFYYPLEYYTAERIKFGSTIYSKATLPGGNIINSIRYTGFLLTENDVTYDTYEETL